MNIFGTYALKWWQFSILKLSLLSLGIYIGATWPIFFASWAMWLLVIFIVTAVYLIYVWYTLQKSSSAPTPPPTSTTPPPINKQM